MEEASERHSSVAGRGDEPGPVARGRCALDQELFVVVELCLSLFKKIYIYTYIYIYLFIYLFGCTKSLVVTCRIASALRIFSCGLGTLSCGMQDLIP